MVGQRTVNASGVSLASLAGGNGQTTSLARGTVRRAITLRSQKGPLRCSVLHGNSVSSC